MLFGSKAFSDIVAERGWGEKRLIGASRRLPHYNLMMHCSLPTTLLQTRWEKMVSFIPWRACGKSIKIRRLE